jgi:hypothetical protein
MFSDFSNPATLARLQLQLELTQTNKIQPEPCNFLFRESLPPRSVIRFTSTALGGAVPPCALGRTPEPRSTILVNPLQSA